MSGKLDQSLDEILSTQRRNAGRRRSTRRSAGGPAKAAPVGGIQKTAKPARGNAAQPAPAKTAGATGVSKVVVSNMPKDVSEAQIKEYFSQSVGPVKKVELSYGPGGVSRGIATVIFSQADGASKAFAELNGILIDNRPVKVEVVVASADLIPQPKTLGQRITQPKAQPKSAANDKRAVNGAKGATGIKAGLRKGLRRGRNSRPAKKTAEELDSEMADYFDKAGNNEAAGGAAAPATANGDAPMDDGIM